MQKISPRLTAQVYWYEVYKNTVYLFILYSSSNAQYYYEVYLVSDLHCVMDKSRLLEHSLFL